MTPTLTRTDSRTSSVSTASRVAHLPVSVVCAGATAVGAVALFGYGAIAQALGVPMQAGDPGASEAVALTPASFSIGVVSSMVLGTLLAVALARWAKNPARTFVRSALVLLAVSLFFPLAASHTEESTRLTLALGHLVAAATIVPLVTRRLAAVRHSRTR
jgi:uncharacterized protein DUF6069